MIPRLYIDSNLSVDLKVDLSKMHANYLMRVLRLEEGSVVKIFNGRSGEWEANYESETPKKFFLSVNRKVADQQNIPKLTLIFSPTKNMNSTYIVEKATELGVTSIQPVTTERTVVRKVNKEKLMNSAIEASEQCERMDIPKIHDLKPLKEVVQSPTYNGQLIFFDESKAGEALRNLKLNNEDNAILIGPEGGFSDDERQYLNNLSNSESVHMGGRILRADTAAIAGLSAYQALLGDWHVK